MLIALPLRLFSRGISVCMFIMVCVVSFGQRKYGSLMWEVSGNGLNKSSYLYGTMHISGKLAFQLGDPFYDALESVDVVALELEPEAWLEAIFADPSAHYWSVMPVAEEMYYDEYASDSPLPALKGYFRVDTDWEKRLKDALLYDPALLNYLLFRYGDNEGSLDYEEDTWLDMHIYQTGKKMGKTTIGLETYAQSDEFIRKAAVEEATENNLREWDEGDILELTELRNRLEPAYRDQDLDLIDSLNRRTTSKAFQKYILEERNVVFVRAMDSILMSGNSLFAAMGCAHLPGRNGVIELLRAKGYQVEPVQKGLRNAKRRKELDNKTMQCEYSSFVTFDGQVKFQTPSKVYHTNANAASTSWIALDIANGASFSVIRLKSYTGLSRLTGDEILGKVQSMLYETIAGDIISNTEIKVGNYRGIDVVNQTRRGDHQRQRIIILPQEILVLKLSAPGSKVKQGYGAPFFEKVEVTINSAQITRWEAPDGSVSIEMPGNAVHYIQENDQLKSADIEVVAADFSGEKYYLLQRHVIEDPGFIDEDRYELNRLLRAFCEDRSMDIFNSRQMTISGLPALEAALGNDSEVIKALFVIQGLSYYVASTNDSDSIRAKAFLESATFKIPVYSTFTTYTNTDLCFAVDLPYTPMKEFVSAEMMMFNPESEIDINSPYGTNGSYVLNPPGEAARIYVDFQRFHEFSDGEDRRSFTDEKRSLVLGLDMELIRATENWSDHGAEFTYIVGDTGSVRRYMHLMVLHNKSFYHLSATYDSLLGPGDMVLRAFESFRSTDTVFPYPHFNSRDEAYLEALASSDSLIRQKALTITPEMDFSPQSGALIRSSLASLRGFAPDDIRLIRNKLIFGLSSDTTLENIQFISREFLSHTDSAAYQLDLLTVLLQMKTKASWEAYRRLVIEEPPILFDEMGGSGCELLFDSVKLAAPLIPDLMQLLAIDEYEESIYHLMAVACDSGWIKPDAYRYQVPQLLVEARNELKRLNAKSESGYGFNTSALLDYCSLLQPLRKQKDVAAFFSRAAGTKKMALLLDLIAFDLDHGMPLADSLITKVSRSPEHVHDLYRLLYAEGIANRMPEPFDNREKLLDAYLRGVEQDGDMVIDSIQIVKQISKEIRGVPMSVYYCKIHRVKTGQWLGKVLAFDARQQDDAWPLFIESDRSLVIDEDEDAVEELEKEYLYMEELNREYINFGIGGTDFNMQWY